MSIISDVAVYHRFMSGTLTFGEWLHDHLKERGLTQAALADRLNVAPTTVNAWVNGGSLPRRRVRREIAEALDVPERIVEAAVLGQIPVRSRGDQPDRESPPSGDRAVVDFNDPFLEFWASYSGDIDPEDKEVLQEFAKVLIRRRKEADGDRG